MTTNNRVAYADEVVLSATGTNNQVQMVRPLFRKITFRKITVLDDTDIWSDGEFIFEAFVDGVSLGLSKTIRLGTDDWSAYDTAIAIKHYPLASDGATNPLVIKFRAVELDWSPTSERVEILGEMTREFDSTIEFGLTEASGHLQNRYLKVEYLIEELTESGFNEFENVDGKVFAFNPANPGVDESFENAEITLHAIRKRVDSSGEITQLPDDGILVSTTTASSSSPEFEFGDLDTDLAYRLIARAPGYSSFSHDLSYLHQTVSVVMFKTYLAGKVVNDDGEPIREARVDLYKTKARVVKELSCFWGPDTSKPVETTESDEKLKLDAGTYDVVNLEEKGSNFWARVRYGAAPGGYVWVCYRTGTHNWAQLNSKRTKLKLTKKLNCFHGSDPGSPVTVAGTMPVKIEPGDYDVASIETGEDTDYIEVYSGDLPYGSAWICSRWKDSNYALPYDERIVEDICRTDAGGEFRIQMAEYLPDRFYRLRTVKDDYFDGQSKRARPWANPYLQLISIEMEYCPGILDESEIVDLLPTFDGWTYGGARYPSSFKVNDIVNLPAPPKRNGCNSFAETIITEAWGNKFGLSESEEGSKLVWNMEKHKAMMIFPIWDTDTDSFGSDEFGPITLAIGEDDDSVRMALPTDNDDLPPPWTIVQGWKKWEPKQDPTKPTRATGIKGHTFFIVDAHPESGRVLVLESNTIGILNGPGLRGVGNIGDLIQGGSVNPNKDGKYWWERFKTWTWEKIKEDYWYRSMARLKVNNLKWVK